MTKEEFRKLSRKCPWFFHNGEPCCLALKHHNCAKKNCPFVYWMSIKIGGALSIDPKDLIVS